MSYKLLEFGGHANVILRANIDMSINGNTYNAGDVVFLFEGVNLEFTYNEKHNTSTIGRRNQLSYFERNINTINISNLSLTTDYIEVFGEQQTDNFDRSVIERVVVTDRKFYTLQLPSKNKVYILNQGQLEVELDAEYRELTIKSDIEDGEYTVIYSTAVDAPLYDINGMESIPYMQMEIMGLGNVDKEDGNVYIRIPKVNLINRPDFSLSDRIGAQDLTFQVIQDTILFGVY